MTTLRTFVKFISYEILVNFGNIGAIVYERYSGRSVRFPLFSDKSHFLFDSVGDKCFILGEEELLMTYSFLFNSLTFLLHDDKIL